MSGEADDEDSGESDGESSTHSSHGEAESVEEPKKPKRTRTAFSNLQLDQLELAFSRSHYPDVFTREDLSNKLNIKEDRIQVRGGGYRHLFFFFVAWDSPGNCNSYIEHLVNPRRQKSSYFDVHLLRFPLTLGTYYKDPGPGPVFAESGLRHKLEFFHGRPAAQVRVLSWPAAQVRVFSLAE